MFALGRSLGYLPRMRTILLIEDDDVTRETLAYYLHNELGYKCLEARNGPQAVVVLKSVQIDIVLCDFLLEDDTAIPVIKWLEDSPTPPKVVIMSAMSKIEETLKTFKVDALLKKPFDLDALENVLNSV